VVETTPALSQTHTIHSIQTLCLSSGAPGNCICALGGRVDGQIPIYRSPNSIIVLKDMCTLYPRRRLSHSSSVGFWIEYFSYQRATRSRPSHPLPLKNGCSSNPRFHRRKYFFWRDKFHETSLPRNWKQQIPLSRLLRNSLSRKIWYDYTLRMVASGTPYHEYRKLTKTSRLTIPNANRTYFISKTKRLYLDAARTPCASGGPSALNVNLRPGCLVFYRVPGDRSLPARTHQTEPRTRKVLKAERFFRGNPIT